MQSQLLADQNSLRTWAVVLDTGEEAKQLLTDFAAEHRITAAQLTAIGAFESALLGWYDLAQQDYVDINVDEQVEVLDLAGDVSQSPDGDTFLHLHAICGRRDGSTIGGHVQSAVVRPTLEVIITDVPARLARRHDGRSGLALLRLDDDASGRS
jgi:uncharacterized protein